MGDDVKCQASGDETAGAVCVRIWCKDILVNLLWKPSISSCPTRWWEKTSPESTCLAFLVPVCFRAAHPACEPPDCFMHVRGATGVDEDWPGSLGTTVIMLSCPVNLAGWSPGCWWSGRRWPGWSWSIRWQYFEFWWMWWMMSKWLDWTLQNHLVSFNCSVSSTTCSSIHSTYHVLSGPSSEAHKSLAWSCVIIEAKSGSSTGNHAPEELGWESQIK